MEATVESLCNQLARNRLLDANAVRTLRGKWRGEAGAAADSVSEFRAWLVKNGTVSEFQLDMLERGYGEFLSFGEYKLLERIGTGRMAGVYKAVHPLGQAVAIKVLPPSKSKHPQLLGRFLREARLAVKLDHDHVVRTFQGGLNKDMYYIVMEYLDGETLEETLKRRRRLPVQEAIPIMTQALEGLDHLHEVGLVHRDLKPGNLMLVPSEEGAAGDTTLKCTVKILDMGLGRALFDEGNPIDQTPGPGEAANLTSDGAILGTLNYMAPEQARHAHSADIRADIYSLGCVFYEMLTGQPPFDDTNFARQMRRHAEEQPQPIPSQAPEVPPALDQIVQKMLAKDPALRYATPGQVLKDLKALPQAVPVAKPLRPMRSYLTWLETQRKDNLPEAAPSEAATNGTVPVPMQPLAAAGALPVAAPVAIPTAMPVAAPLPAGPIYHNPALVFFKGTWERIRAHGWGPRDWIAAGVGAGAVLVFLGFIWLLRLLFG